MRDYEYEITLATENDSKVFKKACELFENGFPSWKKLQLLVDVDGSTIQVYQKEEQEVVIYDDYDIGTVFALADIDIQEIFADIIQEALTLV